LAYLLFFSIYKYNKNNWELKILWKLFSINLKNIYKSQNRLGLLNGFLYSFNSYDWLMSYYFGIPTKTLVCGSPPISLE